jgi:hypothetical protein
MHLLHQPNISLLILTIFLLFCQSIQTSLIGHLHFPYWPSRCLELDDPNAVSSAVVLNECDTTSVTQLWRLDNARLQITTLKGNKCLTIHQDGTGVDEPAKSPVEATTCKYITSGRSSAKGQADGYQKLVFLNETIIWRGQSKVLPYDIEDRYCVEVEESEESGSALALEHCTRDRQQQHFQFEDIKRCALTRIARQRARNRTLI